MCPCLALYYRKPFSAIFFISPPIWDATLLKCLFQYGEFHAIRIDWSSCKFNLEHCHHFRYPFNWRTPLGYFIAVILQLISVSLPMRYIGCFVSFALAGFVIALALAKDMKGHIKLFDEYAKAKLPERTVYHQLAELIRFTTIKRLVWLGIFDLSPFKRYIWIFASFRLMNYFSEIYEITLTLIFVGCTGIISVALLMIQQELVRIHFLMFHLVILNLKHWVFNIFCVSNWQTSDEIDSIMLFESVFCGFWSIILVFSACEFGQRFSNAFDSFDDELGQFDWYLQPIGIQRMLPMIIVNAQQPMLVQCYGNVPCGRETFKKVKQTHEMHKTNRLLF